MTRTIQKLKKPMIDLQLESQTIFNSIKINLSIADSEFGIPSN